MKVFRLLKNHKCPNTVWSVQMRLPVFFIFRRGYDISNDDFKIGFWRLDILFSFDKFHQHGFGLRAHKGWVPAKIYRTEYAT